MAQVFVAESSLTKGRNKKTEQRGMEAILDKWFNVTPHGQLEDFTFDLAEYIMIHADAKELKAMNDNFVTRKLIDIIRKDERFNDDIIDELTPARAKLLKQTIGVHLYDGL